MQTQYNPYQDTMILFIGIKKKSLKVFMEQKREPRELKSSSAKETKQGALYYLTIKYTKCCSNQNSIVLA